MGAVLGGAFGSAIHSLFPLITASPGAYALVGMGAVVAGTTRGPVSAVLIIFEMTGDYRIILPLMFACSMGLVISTLLSSESIYTMKLVRRGVNIFAGKDLNVLKSVKVSQVMRPDVETVSLSLSVREFLKYHDGQHSFRFLCSISNQSLKHQGAYLFGVPEARSSRILMRLKNLTFPT